jgi:hypothetical protein
VARFAELRSLARSLSIAALVVPAPIHDAGIVVPGATVEHAFELRNEGESTVRVTRVVAACGCTVAEYDREIAPGATGTVRAVVETRSFGSGPFSKTVDVQTDDPALPRVTLTVRGDLRAHVEVAPHRLRWSVSGDGRGADPQTVTLTSATRAGFEVLGVDTSAPWLVAVPARGADGRWQVEVKLAEGLPPGALAGRVSIHTDHPGQPLVVVPISGFVSSQED